MRIPSIIVTVLLVALFGCSKEASQPGAPSSASAEENVQRKRDLEKKLIDLKMELADAEKSLKDAEERLERDKTASKAYSDKSTRLANDGTISGKFLSEAVKEDATPFYKRTEDSVVRVHTYQSRANRIRREIAETEKALIDVR